MPARPGKRGRKFASGWNKGISFPLGCSTQPTGKAGFWANSACGKNLLAKAVRVWEIRVGTPRNSGLRTVCLNPRLVGGFVHLVLGFSPFAEG